MRLFLQSPSSDITSKVQILRDFPCRKFIWEKRSKSRRFLRVSFFGCHISYGWTASRLNSSEAILLGRYAGAYGRIKWTAFQVSNLMRLSLSEVIRRKHQGLKVNLMVFPLDSRVWNLTRLSLAGCHLPGGGRHQGALRLLPALRREEAGLPSRRRDRRGHEVMIADCSFNAVFTLVSFVILPLPYRLPACSFSNCFYMYTS